MYHDSEGSAYTIGECQCDIKVLTQIVDTVVIALPAIAYIGCQLLFGAFQLVLEAGISFIPGGAGLSAGMRAGIQGAKTVAENGFDAPFFGSWFSGACGAEPKYPDYTRMSGIASHE